MISIIVESRDGKGLQLFGLDVEEVDDEDVRMEEMEFAGGPASTTDPILVLLLLLLLLPVVAGPVGVR